MFPLINKQPRRGVTIPDLAGGVNYRDGITEVLDNQLTDCKNMWFKDGVLKTRPPFQTDKTRFSVTGRAFETTEYTNIRVFENIKNTVNGFVYTLAVLMRNQKYTDSNGVEHKETLLNFFWVGDNKNIKLSSLTVNESNATFFVTVKGSTLYCYASDRQVYKLEDFNDSNCSWNVVGADEMYTPTVYTHCKAEGELCISESAPGSEGQYPAFAYNCIFTGTQVEDFNIIGGRYKAIYSTVNNDLFTDTMTTVPMMYPLPVVLEKSASKINDLNDKTIKVTITHKGGAKVTHTATITDGEADEGEYHVDDGLRLKLHNLCFYFHKAVSDTETIVAQLLKEDFVEDNMEVELPFIFSDSDKDKIFSMTNSEWFGGAASGISGGTRLFLGGNKTEKEKNLVVWSDLNRPLYFPENSYFYVGDGSSAVTGFGKQSDMLVIFKENETYFTQYVQNTDITAENLINQSVVGYTSSSVYFPLTLIHPNVGCDLPDTVQLCRNRLVWATTAGKVYTLTSNNQYSERNIYEVGEMVERHLKGQLLGGASACDWEGHYVLLCGNKAFLMDYNSSGYQYVYSYQKNEDANIKIPWYCWELKFAKEDGKFYYPRLCKSGDTLIAFGLFSSKVDANVGTVSFVLNCENTADGDKVVYDDASNINFDTVPVSCSFTTKLFNFGAANHRKNIDSVGLSLGANGGVPMNVTFVTDCGEDTEFVTLYSGDTKNYTAGHIQSVVLNPCVRGAIRFGVKISCDGAMSIDGATINYRLLGPAR